MNIERISLLLLGSVGMIFCFLTPPFQVPDEPAHYFKALNLAQGRILCAQDEVYAPANYVSLPEDVRLVKIKGAKEKKVSGSSIKEGLTAPASVESSVIPRAVCNAYPVGHAIQAVGLKIGIAANAPPLAVFYLARLFTLAAAIFLIYSAIRIAPFGKLIFALFGLLPMTAQQLGSFSYDALHFGLVFLFTAYLLKLANESKKLSVRDGGLLFGLSLLALNAKPGYFLLSLLVFVLPKAKFENMRKYWLYTIGFVLAAALFFGLGRLMFNEQGAFPKGVDPQAQAMFVLENPFRFVSIVIDTAYDRLMFFYETIVLKPGWLDSSLSSFLYVFMGLGVVLLLRSQDERIPLGRNQRLVMLVASVAQLLFVFLSLYLVWTPVGEDKVIGVQGRYLITVLPVFVLSFYKSGFSFRSEWIKNNIPIAFVIFVLIAFICVFFDVKDLYYKDFGEYLR